MLAAIALRDYGRPWTQGKSYFGSRWLRAFAAYSMAPPDESDQNGNRAFSDYLDSYFNSFDFYPTCTRHVFQRNDAFALWQDFLLVAGDLATTSDRMQANPENYMNLRGWTSEDVKARKEEIAREIQSRIAAKKSDQ